jgi:hypothetical protein
MVLGGVRDEEYTPLDAALVTAAEDEELDGKTGDSRPVDGARM